MIAQCPACLKLVDIQHGHSDGDRVGLTCPACAATTWLGPAPAGETPPASPVAVAPPAAAPATDDPAPPAAAPDPAPPSTALALPALDVDDLADDETGQEVLEKFRALRRDGWHDDKRHNEFAQFALLTDQLALAGKAYRRARDADAGDAMAVAGTQRVLTLAMTKLDPLKTQRAEAKGGRTALKVALAVLALGAIAGLLRYLLGQMSDLGNM